MSTSVLAENLKLLMEARGFSRKSLALAAGKNETYVRDIITGKSKHPAASNLALLADALGCTLEELTSPGVRIEISIRTIFTELTPENKENVVDYASKLKRLQDLESRNN